MLIRSVLRTCNDSIALWFSMGETSFRYLLSYMLVIHIKHLNTCNCYHTAKIIIPLNIRRQVDWTELYWISHHTRQPRTNSDFQPSWSRKTPGALSRIISKTSGHLGRCFCKLAGKPLGDRMTQRLVIGIQGWQTHFSTSHYCLLFKFFWQNEFWINLNW